MIGWQRVAIAAVGLVALADMGMRAGAMLELRRAAIEARRALHDLPARINRWPMRRRAWLAWRILTGRTPGLEGMQ